MTALCLFTLPLRKNDAFGLVALSGFAMWVALMAVEPSQSLL